MITEDLKKTKFTADVLRVALMCELDRRNHDRREESGEEDVEDEEEFAQSIKGMSYEQLVDETMWDVNHESLRDYLEDFAEHLILPPYLKDVWWPQSTFYVTVDDGDNVDMCTEGVTLFEALCAFYQAINSDGSCHRWMEVEIGYFNEEGDEMKTLETYKFEDETYYA